MSAKEVKSSKVSNKKGNKGDNAENIVRYTIYGISGVVVVCLLLAVVFMIIPNTVATAGNEKITKDEFIFFHTQAINSYLQYNSDGLDPDEFLDQSIGEGLTFRSMAVAAATQQVHEYAIQYDLAKKNGMSLTQDEINSTLTNLRDMLEETANEYSVSVNIISKANFGLPFRKVAKIYEKAMLGDKYANYAIANMNLTDEDIQNYYEENKENLDRVKARHILLKIEETDSEVKIQGIEKKAQELLQQIKDGADFDEYVKEYSQDTGSVENGGQLTFGRNQMVKEFEDFVFNNEPGTIDVVKTQYGYHIIEVMDHLFGYEANADMIRNGLPSVKYNEELKTLKDGTYALKFRNSFNDVLR